MQSHPILSVAMAARQTGLPQPTLTRAVDHLCRLDMLRVGAGRQRGRLFVYGRYLEILSEGTETPPG